MLASAELAVKVKTHYRFAPGLVLRNTAVPGQSSVA